MARAVGDLFRQVFTALDASGTPWLVLRGVGPFAGPDDDVDVLVGVHVRGSLDAAFARTPFVRVPPQGSGSHRFPLRVREHEFRAYDEDGDVWVDLDVLSEVSFGRDLEFRTDLAPELLARRRVVDGVPRLDPGDEAWLLVAHDLLKRGDRFSRGVAACLTDSDSRVRAQALLFFEAFPEAAGAELLVPMARTRRGLFAGVPNPFAPSMDLEWQLLRSIGARILRNDADALAFGYACAVEAGHAQPIIAALTFTDPDWVVAHAEAIVTANPGVAATLLNSLQRSSHDVGAVGARIAPIAVRDPKFQETLELLILDESTRRRILDGLIG